MILKVKLFDFQKDALDKLKEKILAARSHASVENPQAIAFSAPTGSGKTIVLTALFERIFEGDVDLPAQRDAVILWLSDMPELNEQTRRKIETKSDRIKTRNLITIDSTFDSDVLEAGNIYFVNTQKLGNEKLLTKVGDGRKYSIWTTLTNTARAYPDRFYVVIDEAHRGMAAAPVAAEARTLMQRFLLGYPDVGLLAMPLVVGVSATPRRFMDLLEQAPHTVHRVAVQTEAVRLSGLLKDRILIHYPEQRATAEMSLLGEAAARWAEISRAWEHYCASEEEPRVRPILVVQIENGTTNQLTRTNLADAIGVIERAVGRRLLPGELAHALHETGDLEVGSQIVRRVDASRIEDDPAIGVVFFKTSLSTGWDCPRAEVMMSFRRAEEHTYIAQLLGRMVRTPLARRVEKDAALNDVHLFLPHFDEGAVHSVVNDLANIEDIPPAETGTSKELVILKRREELDDVFAELAELVTYRVNGNRAQSNLRRLAAIARGLTMDGISVEAWDEAKSQVVSWIDAQVAGLISAGSLAGDVEALTSVGLATLTVEQGGQLGPAATPIAYRVPVSSVDIDHLFEQAGRVLSNGLHMAYWQANADRPAMEVKAEAILVSRDHTAMAALEAAAGAQFDALFDANKRSIMKLREQRRAHYERLRTSSAKPSEIPWHLPETIDFRRRPDAPRYEGHIFIEDDGSFRAELGTWEEDVLAEEALKPDFLGWFRNVDRKQWSLEIPYATGGLVKPMFPDLVIFRQGLKGLLADVLEPHDPSLADNVEKAVGLAYFAESHGHLFGRIQLIRKLSSPSGGEKYVRLEINSTSMQQELKRSTTNPQLDALFHSHGVVEA
ncbi:MAG: type III deoxyribonuclease [Rhizobiaceae bacterium]|nr:type III deoxyribonuclease [Rhizobiaceae bacterium]